MIVICILFSVSAASADLSDSLFCMIRKDEVTISLKRTLGYYKCKDTIMSLDHLTLETAKDLIKIQTYINGGRDKEYRTILKLQKQDLIKKLQASKSTIVTNMQTFESTLFQKSVRYFIINITPYKIRLQKSLVKIDALSGVATPELNVYADLLKAQVSTINSLSKVTTSHDLNTLLARYIYLKKAIE